MDDALTKSQLEKLGRRLRKGDATQDDMRMLARYRRSFLTPYGEVVSRITRVTSLVPSGRPAKSTASIVSKLQRQTGTLPQMQDIAGCRLVVANEVEQDSLIESLRREFTGAEVIDRRAKPSFGYRAVHLVVTVHDLPVEIQIRTRLQDLWAQYSEGLAFSVDPAIKYGGGPSQLVVPLNQLSELIASHEAALKNIEALDRRFYRIPAWIRRFVVPFWASPIEKRLQGIRKENVLMHSQIADTLDLLVGVASAFRRRGGANDLPD